MLVYYDERRIESVKRRIGIKPTGMITEKGERDEDY